MSQCSGTTTGLSAAEALEYRSEVENTPADQGFYRLRQARVLVVGDGPALGAVLRAGIGTGWRRTTVLADEVPEYALRDEFQHVLSDSPARMNVHLHDTDLVVHVTADFGELIEMCRRCRAANVSLAQVYLRGPDAWLTPVHPAGGLPVEAAWRRLAPSAGGGGIGLAAAALIGAQVALTCFGYLTGAAVAADRVLLRLDGDSLAITEHRYQWGGPIAEAPPADPVAPDELLDRLPAFVDPHVGLFTAVEQAGVVSWVTVADPLRRWPAHRVLGWADDPETAKVRGVLAAMATYGALATGRGWAWGTDLITGARRRVWLEQDGPHAAVGVAAGLCWQDAVAAGLQAHSEAQWDPVGPIRRWADDSTPSDVDALAKSLAVTTGRTPVVVPLDADPAARRLLPFVTQVLLVP